MLECRFQLAESQFAKALDLRLGFGPPLEVVGVQSSQQLLEALAVGASDRTEMFLQEGNAVAGRVDHAPDGGVGPFSIGLRQRLPVGRKFLSTEAVLELGRLERPLHVPDQDGGVLAAGGELLVVARKREIDDGALVPGQLTPLGP